MHRVDAYGVPSIVGPVDGDDGLVHLHTHPLDPISAFVAIVTSGGTMANHDYASWPAPSP